MLTYDFTTPAGVARERFAHLSTRVVNILVRKGQRSWDQIARSSDEDLLTLERLVAGALSEIRTEQRVQVL